MGTREIDGWEDNIYGWILHECASVFSRAAGEWSYSIHCTQHNTQQSMSNLRSCTTGIQTKFKTSIGITHSENKFGNSKNQHCPSWNTKLKSASTKLSVACSSLSQLKPAVASIFDVRACTKFAISCLRLLMSSFSLVMSSLTSSTALVWACTEISQVYSQCWI